MRPTEFPLIVGKDTTMRILHRSFTPALTVLVVLALAALSPAPAAAQADSNDDAVRSNIAFGGRLGYTHWNAVDQMHFGFHLKFGEIMPNVRLTPGIEAGLGDDTTVITLNGDVAYDFTEFVVWPWNLYGGGSLSFNTFKPSGGDTATDLGLSGLLGLERSLASGHQALVEVRFGLVDSPDFKLTFGYTLF